MHAPVNTHYPYPGSKSKTRSRSIRRHSGLVGMSDATFLAKLPLVDSDEDMELVKLVPHGIPSSEGETSPTGREHPFSPMVNREMLLNIVKDAFQQTDEQQINFEATLKQEYSRRSKGEVCCCVVVVVVVVVLIIIMLCCVDFGQGTSWSTPSA